MEPIRLQKFIADSGLMSRRAAEEEIKNGNVSVNGHIAELGMKIDPKKDVVSYRNKRITYQKREYTYIMINKPRGYLSSTSDDRGRKCVTELLDGVDARVYPVGRLDLISEGMLLLTDDGELKNRLTHPSHSLPKLYRVKVGGRVTEEQFEKLKFEASRGLPCVIFCHTPITHKHMRHDPHHKDLAVSDEVVEFTRKVSDFIINEDTIKAVFAGHLHKNGEEDLGNKKGYVLGALFKGIVGEIIID
jgi:23S rRNA-/tRNA-specific pseudouridylate synthase